MNMNELNEMVGYDMNDDAIDAVELAAPVERVNDLAANTGASLSFTDKMRLAQAATNFANIWDEVRDGDELLIRVSNILTVNIDKLDETTGEVVTNTRTIFIDPDGRSWATCSDAVHSFAQMIHSIFGPADTWEGTIPLRFSRKASKSGNFFVNTDFAID